MNLIVDTGSCRSLMAGIPDFPWQVPEGKVSVGFRALIGELFPIFSFPALFPYQILRTLLGTYLAPIGDGASIWAKAREVSGERSD